MQGIDFRLFLSTAIEKTVGKRELECELFQRHLDCELFGEKPEHGWFTGFSTFLSTTTEL